jgi:hypothetical protein
MSDIALDLFAEDRAHEELLRALATRIAGEEDRSLTVRIRSARGGHGRALTEFDLYKRSLEIGILSQPDLVIVAIDANCQRFNQAQKAIRERLAPPLADRVAVACPDPHIERWYMADPESFHEVVGRRPALPRAKCDRDFYKRLLIQAIRDSGQVPTLGGVEFAQELAGAMDLYRAGREDHSLKAFVDDFRGMLRRWTLDPR